MSKPRWVRTLVAQVALCIALYFAFQLGQPQKFVYNKRSESRPLDLYFVSVRGGFRPVFKQTHLLKLDALRGPSNETGNNQLHWLMRIVEASRGNWRIVVGFHSFVV